MVAHYGGVGDKRYERATPQSTALTAPSRGAMRNALCVESLSLRRWDRLRWSGGMELCNKFDAVFIKNGVFEDVFINENLFNKKLIIIRRNSNENE